jgi:hypothetical protein
MKNVNKYLLLIAIFMAVFQHTNAQNLDSLMNLEATEETIYTTATFKATKLINGHSIETPSKGVLQFMILHRFGVISNGLYDFFGLDNATIRLGLDYGISERFAIGIGRSTVGKAVDGYLKYKILRQSQGENEMPVTLTAVLASSANTVKFYNTEFDYKFRHRLNYTSQLLVARKFNSSLSLQLMPTLIHKNLVDSLSFNNTIFSIGAGGRIKLTKRFALTFEYYYVTPNQLGSGYKNALAIGVDIETGGHVFQFHFTNAFGMTDPQFITETTDSWLDRNFRLGFNISRAFRTSKASKTW